MTTETVLTDEQIQQAAQCLTAEVSVDGESLVLKNVNGCICAIEQAVLQSPEVQAWKRDADRYRALRDEGYQLTEDDPNVCNSSFNVFFGEELDREADALMARFAAAMEKQP